MVNQAKLALGGSSREDGGFETAVALDVNTKVAVGELPAFAGLLGSHAVQPTMLLGLDALAQRRIIFPATAEGEDAGIFIG